jgi:hypothetical protein
VTLTSSKQVGSTTGGKWIELSCNFTAITKELVLSFENFSDGSIDASADDFQITVEP